MIAPKNPSRYAPISGFGYVGDDNGTGVASAEATMEQQGSTDALPEGVTFEAEKEAVESPRGYTAPPLYRFNAAAQAAIGEAATQAAPAMGLLMLVKRIPWWGWAALGLGASYALFKWAGVDMEALTSVASMNPPDEDEDEEESRDEDRHGFPGPYFEGDPEEEEEHEHEREEEEEDEDEDEEDEEESEA